MHTLQAEKFRPNSRCASHCNNASADQVCLHVTALALVISHTSLSQACYNTAAGKSHVPLPQAYCTSHRLRQIAYVAASCMLRRRRDTGSAMLHTLLPIDPHSIAQLVSSCRVWAATWSPAMRTDYGMGHETTFAAPLYCLCMVGTFGAEQSHALLIKVYVPVSSRRK